jgi:aspartate-semialdehyde dehydrogenase
VFNVVTGAPEPIVGEFVDHPLVRAVSFTGSTEIGKRLLRRGADGMKRMSMELGGHAPFIVFDDANLDEAVAAAVEAKFQTTGQDCLAANRIYVHAGIHDAFLARFVHRVAALKMGDGLKEGVEIGPLMHERAVAKGRPRPHRRHVGRAVLRAHGDRRRERDDGHLPRGDLRAGRRDLLLPRRGGGDRLRQ